MPSEHDVTNVLGQQANLQSVSKVVLKYRMRSTCGTTSREFVKVVDSAMDELKNTGEGWKDPAVILFVDKFIT